MFLTEVAMVQINDMQNATNGYVAKAAFLKVVTRHLNVGCSGTTSPTAGTGAVTNQVHQFMMAYLVMVVTVKINLEQ